MNIIEKYRFGKMVINGKDYTTDLIILPDSIITNWRRKKGHSLCMEDLNAIIEDEIEICVIGTGKFGLVEVSDTVIAELKSKKIDVIVKKSSDAVSEYNKLIEKNKKIAAAFHLNC